jgi:hypothetical protein
MEKNKNKCMYIVYIYKNIKTVDLCKLACAKEPTSIAGFQVLTMI